MTADDLEKWRQFKGVNMGDKQATRYPLQLPAHAELGTGRRLGTWSMRDGLYYLDEDISPAVATVLSYFPLAEFLLQHRQLGHMLFVTLGQLYPDLYSKISKDKLFCNAF